jgi:hypothetical protein
MKHFTERKLIIALIKDDLINTKLVNGLNAIGLNADDYLLHLSDTIFRLIGIGDDEAGESVFEWYMDSLKKVDAINICENPEALNDLARGIYLELLLEKALYQGR